MTTWYSKAQTDALLGPKAAVSQLPGTVVQGLAAGSSAAAANGALIQAAITAAGSAGGGEVIIPTGTWYTTPLVMRSYVTLKGLGWGSCLTLAAGANAHMVTLYDVNTVFVGFEDIILDGNKANQTAGAIIYLDNTNLGAGDPNSILDDDPNHHMRRIVVRFGKGDGITLVGYRGQCQLVQAFAYHCDGYGFNIGTPDNHLDHCIAAGSGKQGFYITGNQTRAVGLKSFLSGNVTGNSEGFYVNAARCSLIHLEAQDNRGNGFVLVGVTDTILIGNADRNGMGPDPTTGGQGDGLYISNTTNSRIELLAGDRNVSSTPYQRWAYNAGTGNDKLIVDIVVGLTQSGAAGVGSFGANSAVRLSYNGTTTSTVPTPTAGDSSTKVATTAFVAAAASAAQAAAVTAAQGGLAGVNAQTANYTTVLSDAGKLITESSGSATTVTIPTYATVAYPVGTVLSFANLNTGAVTIAGASGVTIYSPSGARITTQYGQASAVQIAVNIWVLSGQTVV